MHRLALVADAFDVFVTVDRNLAFQQNVSIVEVAIIVLRAKSNRLDDLRPLVPQLLSSLGAVKPGEVLQVPAP